MTQLAIVFAVLIFIINFMVFWYVSIDGYEVYRKGLMNKARFFSKPIIILFTSIGLIAGLILFNFVRFLSFILFDNTKKRA